MNIGKIPVTVDGEEYVGAELSPEAQEFLRHIVDLRDKRDSLEFQLTQVQVAEHAFTAALETTIRKEKTEAA